MMKFADFPHYRCFEKAYLVSMKNYIALLRIPQYSKNLFIFLPLFFALHLQEPERLFKVSLAFLGFCLLASAVYISQRSLRP